MAAGRISPVWLPLSVENHHHTSNYSLVENATAFSKTPLFSENGHRVEASAGALGHQ